MKKNLSDLNKIAVIGNSCGGKTILSKKLSQTLNLPLIPVDSIQFTEGLNLRPYKESIEILKLEQTKERWIIDGYGPLDILQERLALADLIIMIDLPLYTHYFWALKRILKNILIGQRKELPANSSERKLSHIIKLFKTIWTVHHKMRPEMLRILERDQNKNKTILVNTIAELNLF